MTAVFRNDVKMIQIGSLRPYEANAKIHSAEQVEKIAAQISAAGWDQPIVVEPDMTIIKGHGRFMAAQKLGLTEVPVIVTDLSKEKAKAIRIADNKVAEAPWDLELLRSELHEIQGIEDLDVGLTGFDLTEVESYLKGFDSPKKEESGSKEVSESEVKNTKFKCPKCDFLFDKPIEVTVEPEQTE